MTTAHARWRSLPPTTVASSKGPGRRGSSVTALAAADDRAEVGDEQPAQRHEPVQEPQVDVLRPMPRPPGLLGGEAGEGHLFDVGVHPHDVGAGVVEGVVLEAPEPRASSEEVAGEAEQPVQAARAAEGAVVAVVHDAGRGRHRRDDQDRRAQEPEHDADVGEDEHAVAADRKDADQHGLALQLVRGPNDLGLARPQCPADVEVRARVGGRGTKSGYGTMEHETSRKRYETAGMSSARSTNSEG